MSLCDPMVRWMRIHLIISPARVGAAAAVVILFVALFAIAARLAVSCVIIRMN